MAGQEPKSVSVSDPLSGQGLVRAEASGSGSIDAPAPRGGDFELAGRGGESDADLPEQLRLVLGQEVFHDDFVGKGASPDPRRPRKAWPRHVGNWRPRPR